MAECLIGIKVNFMEVINMPLCECISCGHTTTTEGHCTEIKCEKCGGEMRRVERPGIGRE